MTHHLVIQVRDGFKFCNRAQMMSMVDALCQRADEHLLRSIRDAGVGAGCIASAPGAWHLPPGYAIDAVVDCFDRAADLCALELVSKRWRDRVVNRWSSLTFRDDLPALVSLLTRRSRRLVRLQRLTLRPRQGVPIHAPYHEQKALA